MFPKHALQTLLPQATPGKATERHNPLQLWEGLNPKVWTLELTAKHGDALSELMFLNLPGIWKLNF